MIIQQRHPAIALICQPLLELRISYHAIQLMAFILDWMGTEFASISAALFVISLMMIYCKHVA